MAFVALEESSSRHLLNDPTPTAAEITPDASGIPVVEGWQVVDGTAEGSRRGQRAAARRTDPDDRLPGRNKKVQVVAPVFDPQISLSNSTLPLGTGQLIKALVKRRKNYLSTSFEFHIYFADAPRLAFTAKMSLRKDTVELSHANHERGKVRRRQLGSYTFCDENLQQHVEARLTSHANEAPVDLTVFLGHEEQKLVSRKAKWHDKLGAYVLDFQGLCDTASCKNVQLCPADGPQTLVNTRFVLGRQSDDSFNVYFRQPFTCLQAFVTALVIFSGSS